MDDVDSKIAGLRARVLRPSAPVHDGSAALGPWHAQCDGVVLEMAPHTQVDHQGMLIKLKRMSGHSRAVAITASTIGLTTEGDEFICAVLPAIGGRIYVPRETHDLNHTLVAAMA